MCLEKSESRIEVKDRIKEVGKPNYTGYHFQWVCCQTEGVLWIFVGNLIVTMIGGHCWNLGSRGRGTRYFAVCRTHLYNE